MEKRTPARDRRTEILDAAAEVVRERGAAHLTLDAVAARSGYSKGGLIHRFPNKDALIEAMIARELDRMRAKHQTFASDPRNAACPHLFAVIEQRLGARTDDLHLQRSLLVAAAERPELLDPGRKQVAQRLREIREEAQDPVGAVILFLAAEAPQLFELLGLHPFSEGERAELYTRLRALAEKGDLTC